MVKIFFRLLFLITFTVQGDEFLQNLIEKGKILNWSEVREEIKRTANERKFFSLGETHLHKSSSGEINSLLLNEFIINLHSFRICSEKINSFWERDEAKVILNNPKLQKVNYYKLSLNSSSMNGCHLKLKSEEGLIVYSGLYHQYPFGRNYEELPSQTSVQRDIKKNIAFDLKNLDGLLISHFEIDYLVNMNFKGVVLNSPTFEIFNIKLKKFIYSFSELINRFESITKKKDIVFIENDSFLNGKERNKRHKRIFAISNLRLLQRGSLIHLYEKISGLDEKHKFLLYQLLKQSKFLVKSFYMEPNEEGEFGEFTFANGHKFYGDFDYIQFLGPTRRGYAMFLESKPDNLFRLLVPGKSGYKEMPDSLDYLLFRSRKFKIKFLDISVRF